MNLITVIALVVSALAFTSCSRQSPENPQAGAPKEKVLSKPYVAEAPNASAANDSAPSEANAISVNKDPELVLRPLKLSRAERKILVPHPEAFLVGAIDVEEKSVKSSLSLHTKAGDCIALWLDNDRAYGGAENVVVNWMVPQARRKELDKRFGELEDNRLTFVLLVPLSAGGAQFWFTYLDKKEFADENRGQFDIKMPPRSGATGVTGGGRVFLFLVSPSRTSSILPITLEL